MLKVPFVRGKRLFILVPPAAQAPPPPVSVNPCGQTAEAQVLATPPASVQFVEPELDTPTQNKPPLLTVQVRGVPPAALLSVNTIAGKPEVCTVAGVPTKFRLF